MKFKRPDSIFGIKARTKSQKRFMKYFIVMKSVVILIIFILIVIFLWKLKNLGK